MATAAYRYQSDDGNVYQVVLPTDFALPLNYIAASGSEPYLPNFISMRYATYQDVLGLYINPAYILSPFGPVNPPPTCTVDGVNYNLVSSYGEVRGSFKLGNVILIGGPQGPPGASGSGGVDSLIAGAGIGVSGATGNVTVTNTGVTSVAAGTGISVSASTGGVTITNTGGSASVAPAFTSSALTLAGSGNVSAAHGLGRVPYLVKAVVKCVTANNGYSAGDYVDVTSAINFAWNGSTNVSETGGAWFNSTTIGYSFSGSGVFSIYPKGGGEAGSLTFADWQLYLLAW